MEQALERALVALVRAVARRARAVALACALASVVLLGWALTHLGVNTHHTAILSDDMPFWRDYNEFAEVFPILDESLIVVIDAETVGAARDAAVLLAQRLEQQPERYHDVYVPGGDPFFEREALLYLEVDELEAMGDQLATVQPILAELVRDPSLGNLATVLRHGIEQAREHPETPVDLTRVFDSLGRAARAVLEGRGRPISWSEMILERKLPGDTARRVVLLEPVYHYDRLLPGAEAIASVRETARELGLTPENGVQVRITGNVALNTEEMITVARNALFAISGSLVLVGAILWVALGAWHIVLAVMLTLLAALAWTAAFAAALVGHLNVVSIAFAILIIGLGVDFGLHLAMRYAELVRGGSSHDAALEEGAGSVGASLVLCALTTAVGFYVFLPTDYKAVAELGLIAGTGMLISLVASLTLLPALLTLWRERDPGRAWAGALWFEKLLITASAHHPPLVRWTALAAALASCAALPLVHFDHNVVRMRDPSTESARTFDELLSESDTTPWTMDLMAGSLAEAQALAARLRGLPEVERAVTLADYVPDRQDEKLAILEELGYFVPEPPGETQPPPAMSVASQVEALRALVEALRSPWLGEGDPARAASAAQAARDLERFLARLETAEDRGGELARFEYSLTGALPDQLQRLWRALDPEPITLESLPASLARRMVAPDGRARVEILPSGALSDNAVHARFVEAVTGVAPEATGAAVTLLEFGRAVVRAFQQALGAAVVAIALLLWLLWRSPSDMLLAMTPLAFASLVTTACAGLLDIPFNFANVLVLPLLLGIGIDSSIHLVHRHRVSVASGLVTSPERELLETSTAQAVLFSALTTMASFGTMALSSHVGFRTLGELLLIGMLATLVANLVVLPALIARRAGAPAGAAPPERGGAR